MWPMLLDYTRDECKRILRKLELEAYASVISAFRAQGELSKEKKRMLHDLSSILSISLERHRAEVRRAVNDEHLYTIADRLSGPNTSTEWAIEGRRLVPLMPRLVPQTAFTAIANSAANAQAAKNASLPVPSATGLKENSENENTENELHGRKRSSSMELGGTPQKLMATERESPGLFVPVPSVTPMESTLAVSPVNNVGPAVVTRTVTLPVGPNPLKITLTTVSHRTTPTVSTSTAHKQVIFMSTSSSPTSPNVLQRSLSVPIVKTVSTSATSISTHQSKPLVSTSGSMTSSNTSSHTASSMMPMDVDSIYSAAASTSPSVLSPTPPLFSAGGFTQTISTSTAPINSTLLSRSRSKTASVPRQPVRPRSNPSSVAANQTPATSPQGLSSQLPIPNSLQPTTRTVSPISKSRSPASRTPSPGSAGHIPRAQSPASSQALLPRSQSPVATAPSLHSPVNNPPRSVSPVSVRSQSPVSVQAAPKTAVSPKSVNKSSVHRPQPGSGTRTLLSPTCKTQTKSLPPVSTSVPCAIRTPLQPSIRASAPAQPVLSSRPSSSQPSQHKIFQGPSHVQVKTNSASPRIQYNTESGLKIITQNVSSSRILPKPLPPASTAQNLSAPTNRITPMATANSAVPGNARVVSLQHQPVGTRMTRAIAPSSITTVGLPGLSTTALRVTLPAGALNTPAVVRATAPGAKPNVILVHKAQVWSQSQGATIVMSSSGPMSRIPAEAVQEAVSFFQRQDRNKPTPGTVTLVKQVPVSQTASLLSTTNVISSSAPMSVCPVSTISGLQSFPSEKLAKEQCSSLQTQEKPVDSDCKNTILADLVQLAGIVPENSASLPIDLQPVEILPVKQSTELSETHESEETSEKNANDENSSVEQVAEGDEEDEEEEDVYDEDCVNIPETKKVVEGMEFLTETSSKDNSKAGKQETPSDIVDPKDSDKSDKYSLLETVDDCSSSAISIQDINLDQLPEGQILELQAQDAAELLSQHGQLSSEVLEILQQAGLQVHQVDVEDEESDVTKISNPKPSEGATESPVLHEDQSVKQKEKLETKLDPQTGILCISEDQNLDAVGDKIVSDTKSGENVSSKNEGESVVDIFSTALASAQLDLHSLEFVGEVTETGSVAIPSSSENGKTPVLPGTLNAHLTVRCKSDKYENESSIPSSSDSNCHDRTTSETDPVDNLMHPIKVKRVDGSDMSSPLLSSASQPQTDEDILLVPLEMNDLNEKPAKPVNTQDLQPETKKSVVIEAIPDLGTISVPSGALVVSNITVELAGLDTSTMKLEDFTSQQEDHSVKETPEDVTEETGSFSQKEYETGAKFISKPNQEKERKAVEEFLGTPLRKRKFVCGTSSVWPGGWIQAATVLFDKISKLKKDGKPFPTHWTLNQDIYKKAIQGDLKPTDFSVIQTKLEKHEYTDLRQFNADVMSVQNLCHRYSAFNHCLADCKDVFTFFQREYKRIADRLQKGQTLSSSKRLATA